ncbi:type IV pilus modification PilV family protein [Microcella frigidaquae]|uniref:Type II secretory pathway pseudopilin PulG n=1 Tax=Microcella frigidaquae TaxID=424758 RepID=A0A840X5Y8_9MICO|nr:type II secretion system protein [Microcella frigidaquae]MBB5617810.1 type II secretory pathway pseudopilin PulG [Microcella frigidaquae]NHN45476.1 type II secretion system protein [Microcella frigidaquae]
MTQQRALAPRAVVPADARRAAADDRGIGLIEIIISMFLISLLAIAFVPVLVTALRASEVNSTSATANRLVSQAIDAARTRGAADCAGAQLLNATSDTVDAQGVTLRVVTSVPAVASCTDGTAMRVTVVAFDLADATRTPIADARTLIYLDGTP